MKERFKTPIIFDMAHFCFVLGFTEPPILASCCEYISSCTQRFKTSIFCDTAHFFFVLRFTEPPILAPHCEYISSCTRGPVYKGLRWQYLVTRLTFVLFLGLQSHQSWLPTASIFPHVLGV